MISTDSSVSMSLARTSPAVFRSTRSTLVESLWFFTISDLMFSTMSVTSSRTP
jgi:hypothetical protein